MGAKHRVRFEPVGIEIEADEDETVLNAAFRQGVMLMHGCKEGQCSACKSFLLDGDIDMERYSTFALADYELEEGYVLLCRSHAYSDLAVELINYDEEMLRSGVPIQVVQTRVETIEPLTRDLRRLVLALEDPPEMAFNPGQYVDITIPGTTKTRSFSMANTPSTDDHLEFVIESGVIGYGILCALGGLTLVHGLLLIWRRRDPMAAALGFAGSMALVSLSIHGIADFNLRIPAVAATLVALMALTLSCSSRSRARPAPEPPPA